MKKETLNGKIAVVLGACGGIGTEVAKLLDENGIVLNLADLNREELNKFEKILETTPKLYKCDVTKKEDITRLYEQVLNEYGRINLLVNTVGIIKPALFENTTYQEIQDQISVNLMGAITCQKEIIPIMKKQGEGFIITLSSLAGIVPETYSSIYTATKFALRGLNFTLNLELKKYNIQVSTIFPDSVDTKMLEYEARCDEGSPLTFLDDPVAPKDVAQAVLKSILKKKVEIIVPRSQGILSKFIMCFPKAVQKLWPKFEEKGWEKKQKFLEKLEEKNK